MAMALRAAQAASLAGPRVAPLRRSRAAPRHAAARRHVCRANLFDKLKEIIPSVSTAAGRCARLLTCGAHAFARGAHAFARAQTEEGENDGRGGRVTTKGSIIELIGCARP